MPWSFGRKEPAAPTDLGPAIPTEGPLPVELPWTGSVQFLVEDVYHITGIGFVAVGRVESGSIRPPVTLRVVPAVVRANVPAAVRVTKAQAHREDVAEVGAGDQAGLVLRPVEGEAFASGWSRHVERPVRKGDRLVGT